MKIKNNIVVNEPSANGRIYEKHMLIAAITKYIKAGGFIYSDSGYNATNYSWGNTSSIIGNLTDVYVEPGTNEVSMRGKLSQDIDNQSYITTAGIGTTALVNGEQTITNFEMKRLYVTI